MSTQIRPSLRRVLSDTLRIINSNSLHFTSLSLLFIFPISLLNTIHTLILPSSPSECRPLDKSQIIPQLLNFLLVFIFNLFAISSVTHSIIHAYHNAKPLELAASLKSIISSFLPLLATKAAYLITMAPILFGFYTGSILMGFTVLGFEFEHSSKPVMAVAPVMVITFRALTVYLGVKWCLMDPIVVAESKQGSRRSAGAPLS